MTANSDGIHPLFLFNSDPPAGCHKTHYHPIRKQAAPRWPCCPMRRRGTKGKVAGGIPAYIHWNDHSNPTVTSEAVEVDANCSESGARRRRATVVNFRARALGMHLAPPQRQLSLSSPHTPSVKPRFVERVKWRGISQGDRPHSATHQRLWRSRRLADSSCLSRSRTPSRYRP